MIPQDIIERLAYTIWERRQRMGFRENDGVKNYHQAEDMLKRYMRGEELGLECYLDEKDCAVLEAMKICNSSEK